MAWITHVCNLSIYEASWRTEASPDYEVTMPLKKISVKGGSIGCFLGKTASPTPSLYLFVRIEALRTFLLLCCHIHWLYFTVKNEYRERNAPTPPPT